MSVLKQNVPARDHLGGPGWVLEVLSFFPLIAICPGLWPLSQLQSSYSDRKFCDGITEGAVTLPEASTSKSYPALSPLPVSCPLYARAIVIFSIRMPMAFRAKLNTV